MSEVQTIARETVDAYGGGELTTYTTELASELDFESIYSHLKGALDEMDGEEDEVAIDITPGRKFMTAIAFAVGMRYDASHVYYLYLDERQYGLLYPEIPKTGVNLYDFTEAF